MAIKTNQIVKILQLKGLGRKTAIKFCELSENEIFDNDNGLKEFLLECIDKKRLLKLPYYNQDDFKRAFDKSDEILYKSQRGGIQILSQYDEGFPNALKKINDAPLILNFKGNYKALNELTGVAIIGTRNPTPEGIKSGEFFGNYFGKLGLNVVSGLAKGCDGAGHWGCLQASGFTTAIVAHGLHTIYPAEHKELAERIISGGGVLLSEYFVGTSALPNYFVERDRLQAGLSDATIVIQTGIKGGTMHAVNATIESKKFLAAVKYKNVYADVIDGNEMLIRQGKAFALTSENLEEFSSKFVIRSINNRNLSETEKSEQKSIQIESQVDIDFSRTEDSYKLIKNVEIIDQSHDSYLEDIANSVNPSKDDFYYNDQSEVGDIEIHDGQDIENTNIGIDVQPSSSPKGKKKTILKDKKPKANSNSSKKINNQIDIPYQHD